MNEPIFILGASRSGTTMLRLMLNAHPNIAVPGEQSYFVSLPVQADSWEAPDLSPTAYEQFVTDYLERKSTTLPGLDIPSVRASILQSSLPQNLRRPYEITLYAWARSQGKSRWGEKTPTNFFFVDVIDDMFPEARYIHLVRDPRAVVHSMNRFIRCGDDTVINATNWCEYIERGADLLEQTVPKERRLTLFYENVTAAPKEAAQRLCDFVEEPFDPDMLSFYETADDYMHPASDTLGGDKTLTRPVSDHASQPKWVKGMSKDQIALVESTCKKDMERYGYEPTGVQPSAQAKADQYLKLAYVAAKRLQHADDRFHLIHYPPLPRLRKFQRTLPFVSKVPSSPS